MILEMDVGNTRLKWRIRKGSVTVASGDGPSAAPWAWLMTRLLNEPPPQRIFAASVIDPAVTDVFAQWCKKQWGVEIEFARSQVEQAGVRNGYQEPGRLGVDRWLAMLAARARCTRPLLVVQVGSAITVDLLDGNGQHLGGYIGPGFPLMVGALGKGTAGVKIDLIRDKPCSMEPGRDTSSAVRSALCAMALGLVQRARDHLVEHTGNQSITIALAGGDAHMLRDSLQGALVMPELVLDGLQFAFSAP